MTRPRRIRVRKIGTDIFNDIRLLPIAVREFVHDLMTERDKLKSDLTMALRETGLMRAKADNEESERLRMQRKLQLYMEGRTDADLAIGDNVTIVDRYSAVSHALKMGSGGTVVAIDQRRERGYYYKVDGIQEDGTPIIQWVRAADIAWAGKSRLKHGFQIGYLRNTDGTYSVIDLNTMAVAHNAKDVQLYGASPDGVVIRFRLGGDG